MPSLPPNPILSTIQSEFLNSTPAAAFWRKYGPQVTGARNRNYGNYLSGQQDDFYNQYLGRVADDPTLLYTDFLDQQDPMAMFRQLAPKQRGESSSSYAPRTVFKTGIGW